MPEKEQPRPWGARAAAEKAAAVVDEALDTQEVADKEGVDFYEVAIALPIAVTPMGALGIVIGRSFPGSTIFFGEGAMPGHMTIRLPKAAVDAVIASDADRD